MNNRLHENDSGSFCSRSQRKLSCYYYYSLLPCILHIRCTGCCNPLSAATKLRRPALCAFVNCRLAELAVCGDQHPDLPVYSLYLYYYYDKLPLEALEQQFSWVMADPILSDGILSDGILADPGSWLMVVHDWHKVCQVHKVCQAIFDDFWPLPLSQTVTNLGPLKKVCHTSWIPHFFAKYIRLRFSYVM